MGRDHGGVQQDAVDALQHLVRDPDRRRARVPGDGPRHARLRARFTAAVTLTNALASDRMHGEASEHDVLEIWIIVADKALVVESEKGTKSLLAEFMRMKRQWRWRHYRWWCLPLRRRRCWR
jgi:hypothetical protein